MNSNIRTAGLSSVMLALSFSAVYAMDGGELVIVGNQEPQSMQAQVTHKEVNGIGLRNVIEQLTRLDPKTNEVLPMLATRRSSSSATCRRRAAGPEDRASARASA